MLWMFTDPKDMIQEPIPPSVWEIKADPAKKINDAVILNDFTKFTLTRTERYLRVLILNENGKEAAEIVDPTGTLKLIAGKVTNAQGQVTSFDKNEDLVEVLSHKRGSRSEYKRILVPPALVAPCVVEIVWYEAAEEGIPTDEFTMRYDVRRPYYAQKVQYVIDPTALRDSGNYYTTRFTWYGGNNTIPFEQSEKKKATILTWTDVPPAAYQPYGAAAFDKIQAYVLSYRTLPNQVNDPARFWRDFSQMIYKPQLDIKFRGGGDHSEWLKSLKSRLPEDHIEALALVASEFRNRYHPHDLLPPEKRARYKDHDLKTSDKVLYREIAKHGFARAFLIPRLFYTVLRDLDLEPKIVLANSFYGHPFNPNEMNIMTLNQFYPSFGYQKEDGTWFLVNPGYAEYDPGETPPRYQGTNALVIDTANGWAVATAAIPRKPASAHRTQRTYEATMSEDLTVKQTMKAEVSGEFSARLRRTYFSLVDEEKSEYLKSDFERYLPAGSDISASSFQNMDTLGESLGYTITWETKFLGDDPNNWIFYRPFTGSYTPLRNDDIWTKDRTQPVVLNHAFDNYDKATLTVPAGFTLRGNPSWQKQNGVGTVILQAQQQGQTIVVERRIVLAVDVIGQEHANQVREFLAWVDEAEDQRLAIVRSQS
jgi:hypothetical protein